MMDPCVAAAVSLTRDREDPGTVTGGSGRRFQSRHVCGLMG